MRSVFRVCAWLRLVSSVRATVFVRCRSLSFLHSSVPPHSFCLNLWFQPVSFIHILFVLISVICSINGIQSMLLPSPLESYLVVLLIHISQCTYMNSRSWRLISQTFFQPSSEPWLSFEGHPLQRLSSKFLQHVFCDAPCQVFCHVFHTWEDIVSLVVWNVFRM